MQKISQTFNFIGGALPSKGRAVFVFIVGIALMYGIVYTPNAALEVSAQAPTSLAKKISVGAEKNTQASALGTLVVTKRTMICDAYEKLNVAALIKA